MISLGDVLRTAESGVLWLWRLAAAHLLDARLAPHAMHGARCRTCAPAAGCHAKLSRLARMVSKGVVTAPRILAGPPRPSCSVSRTCPGRTLLFAGRRRATLVREAGPSLDAELAILLARSLRMASLHDTFDPPRVEGQKC